MYSRIIAFLGAVALNLALSACSGGGSPATEAQQPARAEGMLSRVESDSELEASIKRGLTQAFDADNALALTADVTALFSVEIDAVGATARSAATDSNFSSTYTIEQNVGEADLVKYDGELLYALKPPYSCTACDGTEALTTQVNIFRTDPQTADSEQVGVIPLQGNLNVQGMYLSDSSRLVVLQSSGFYGVCGLGWSLPWYWENQTTRVSVFDTSDPANPEQVTVLELDGAYTASRQLDDKLYLVSRYTPSNPNLPLPQYFSAKGDQLQQASDTVSEIPLSDLLPKLSHNEQQTDLLQATDCFIPTDADSTPESASLTTISVIPLNDPKAIKSSCYTGEAYGMYMSTSALYLTSQRYEYTESSSADFTVVHKFALDGQSIDYRGSAELPGTLGHGEQLDFRLSEHNGLLRVVTSEYDYSAVPTDIFNGNSVDAEADSIDHRVTILRESSTAIALEQLSSLPNESRPQEIGKANERLYGVRFFGDRAYMVTFEQIDPLYVLDLSDPEDPRIAGELEVPGVSDFLHPVNDKLLLTVGRLATDVEFGEQSFTVLRGVKLELFNTADISRPFSMASIELGGRFSFSEAIFQRQAFNYHANFDGDNNDRFSIPADIYVANEEQQGLDWTESGLFTFELRNTGNAGNTSLVEVGRIINQRNTGPDSYPVGSVRRSRYNDDTVYFINNGKVHGAAWNQSLDVDFIP